MQAQAIQSHRGPGAQTIVWDTANSPAAGRDLRRFLSVMGSLGEARDNARARVRGAFRLYRQAQARAARKFPSRFDLKPATARAMVREAVADLRGIYARIAAAQAKAA